MKRQILAGAMLGILYGSPVFAIEFDNNFVLSTNDQSLWGSGNQTYSKSFSLIEQWGSYNGTAPLTAGVNGVIGNAHTLITPEIPAIQLTPYIPSVQLTPDIPATYVPSVCIPYIGCTGGQQITPDIPATYSPAVQATYSPVVPAVYGDTRTGANLSISSSGQVGLSLSTGVSGGSIAASVTEQAKVVLPDQIKAGQAFQVTTSGGASSVDFTTKGPTLQAKIDATLNIDTSISGTACAVGQCASGDKAINVDAGTFNLMAVDTSKNNPLTLFGQSVPVSIPDLKATVAIHKGPGVVPIVFDPSPVIGKVMVDAPNNTSQHATVSGGLAGISTDQKVLGLSLSPTGIGEALVQPQPQLLPVDALQQHVYIPGVLDVNLKIADVEVGSNFQLKQNLSLNTETLAELKFSTAVEQQVNVFDHFNNVYKEALFKFVKYNDFLIVKVPAGFRTVNSDQSNECTSNPNCVLTSQTPVYVDKFVTHKDGVVDIVLGHASNLMFAQTVGHLESIKYILDKTELTNTTWTTIDPNLSITFLCASGSLAGVGNTGNLCAGQPANYKIPGATDLALYNNKFNLQGFNTASFNVATVPLPLPVWLFGIGLSLLFSLTRRRR